MEYGLCTPLAKIQEKIIIWTHLRHNEVGYSTNNIWRTSATSKGQVPHAHHLFCTPAPPFWQIYVWMGCPHLFLA